MASSTPVVSTTHSSGSTVVYRSIFINPMMLVRPAVSGSQPRVVETPSTSTMPMVSTYTFDDYLLDIQRRYASSSDS